MLYRRKVQKLEFPETFAEYIDYTRSLEINQHYSLWIRIKHGTRVTILNYSPFVYLKLEETLNI